MNNNEPIMWFGIPVNPNARCGAKCDGMIGHGPICHEAIMEAARHKHVTDDTYFTCQGCGCDLHGFMPVGINKIECEDLMPVRVTE